MSNKVKLMEITDNLLAQYNTDINGNIQAIHIIREQVVGSKDFSIVLGQIPDSQIGVFIIKPDNFYEVFNYDDLTEQSYYRKDRRVYFHPSMSGKTVKVDYYGIGIDLISASSVYTQIDEYGNIIQTLDDVFEVGKTVTEALNTMGDTIFVIKCLKDLNSESKVLMDNISKFIPDLTNLITIAREIDVKLEEMVLSGGKINKELKDNIPRADRINKELNENIPTGNDLDVRLKASTDRGKEVLDGLKNHEVNIISNKVSRVESFLHEMGTSYVAHRGMWQLAPENTIKAIQMAGIHGYSHVELDLQETSDGVIMLMHDDTVDRTTDGTGIFKSKSFSEIKKLRITTPYGGYEEDEVIRIPTFEEACMECKKYKIGINIDGGKMDWTVNKINKTVSILKKHGLWHKSFFVLSNESQRDLLVSLYSDVNVTWLSNDSVPDTNIGQMKKYKNGFVTYHVSNITEDLIDAYSSNNIPIFIYGCDNLLQAYANTCKNIRLIETNYILPGNEV